MRRRGKSACTCAHMHAGPHAPMAAALELRAATRLAQLWLDRGDRERPLALLVPLYESFDEGLSTFDLEQAHQLIDACRA